MRKAALYLFLSVLIFGFATVNSAQELSPADKEKLKLAERTADRFVQRFRRGLNFGAVWREFKARNAACGYQASGSLSKAEYEKLRSRPELLERFFVANMDYYFVSSARALSLIRLNDEKDESKWKKVYPGEVRRSLQKTRYFYDETVGERKVKRPRSFREYEKNISELKKLTRLFRKYSPRFVMTNQIWRENIKYLVSRGGITHLGVGSGHPHFCIPENVKYYIVDRGLFYFYLIEERGKMKVAGFGIGN